MKTKIIPIPIYFGKLVLVVVTDWNEFDKKYNTNIAAEDYIGVAVNKKGSSTYVIGLKEFEFEFIAHEAVHIVNYIYRNCGIHLDVKNDEPQAYLTGWVVSEVVKFLKEQKIKIQ